MATFIENVDLRNKNRVFADRSDGGRQLAEILRETAKPGSLVLAIPSGGVPVGLEIAEALALDFDLVLVRKVQIPWNTEAGFGAVNMDSDLFINEHLLSRLNSHFIVAGRICSNNANHSNLSDHLILIIFIHCTPNSSDLNIIALF